jgi:hypothetical protein
MSKKVPYSRVLTYFWEKYHRDYAKFNLDPDSLYLKLKKDINTNYSTRVVPDGNKSELLGTELWYLDYKKELTHLFFIDKGLKDFLIETNISDLRSIKRFLNEHGIEKQVTIIKTRDIEDYTFYDFAIHVPHEKDGYAFSLGLDQNQKITLLFCKGDNLTVIPEDHYSQINKAADKLNVFNANTFRLAINTIAYMNCFPECVADGVPLNVPDDYNSINTKQVTLSDKVFDHPLNKINGKMTTPHYRKGFFKYLGSDFYTHKKGQIVFVHETMVNGKAKTIYLTDNTSGFEEKSRDF